MSASSPVLAREPKTLPVTRRVARVLLADTDLASRLTLKSLLAAAGYAVDGAATSAEAIAKLDEYEYELVLADLRRESEESGARLLAYARQKDFRPATALITSDLAGLEAHAEDDYSGDHLVRISDDTVSHLLASVAELISLRADRRLRNSLRKAS